MLKSQSVVEENEMVGGGESSKTNLSKFQKSKNFTVLSNANALGFLTSKASTIFIQLRQTFIKAFILRHFNLECYIKIETNSSGYTIDKILS